MSFDYGEDAADKATGEGELSELARLADQLEVFEADVLRAEEALRAAQQKRDHLSQHVIPERMQACGQTDVGISGGRRLVIKESTKASIPTASRVQAFRWLRDNGHETLIKRELKIGFGKGKDNVAAALADDLRKQGFEFDDKVTVHPQTLIGFVNQKLEAGEDIPFDLFGVVRLKSAKVVSK